MRVLHAVLAASLATAGAVAVVSAQPAAAAERMPAAPAAAVAHAPGTYVPVTPFRIADTRPHSPLAAKHVLRVAVGGHRSVPARNVSAVLVTLTALTPTTSGGLVAYAYHGTRPAIKNLTYQAKTSISVTTVSRVSATGIMQIYNDATSGNTDVVVDVSGYYVGGTPSAAGALHALTTPARVLDTRKTGGALKKLAKRTLTIGGHAGVPTSGVGSVFVALTAISPTAAGALTAYSAGNDRPASSTARFVAGQNRTSFAIVPTNDSGAITIANASSGTVQVVVELLGWTPAGPAAASGAVQTRFPARLVNGTALGAGGTKSVAVNGHGGVPLAKVAAVAVIVSVNTPRHTGGLTAWAGGTAPGTTILQFPYNKLVSNLALVPVGSTGKISLKNTSAGSLKLYVDIVGFVPSTTVTPPAASSSRYVRTATELNSRFKDPTNAGEGCFDAAHGSTFVLLQFGAQLNDRSGVQLTGASQDQITYAALVNSIKGYLTSFTLPACAPPARATIAIGTNNSGSFTKYAAKDRGSDWANKVIDAIAPPAGITVLGANDIEQSFAGTYQNGIDWETAYLAATSHNLLFNGSADSCDSAYGHPGGMCSYWTMAQIYRLAGGLSTRITALPQIYNAGMAAAWTNIYQTGGRRSGYFAGVLTQAQVCQGSKESVCAATYTPQQGWTALYRGLSTVVTTPSLPVVTDLTADS